MDDDEDVFGENVGENVGGYAFEGEVDGGGLRETE